MSATEADVLRLTVTAHEAAADPSLWPSFLENYARAIDADVAVVQRHYLADHRSMLLATHGMSQRFTHSYNEHYSRLNVWREHGSRLYVEGRVVLDQEMYPRPLLKQSEFYNDYLLPNGGTHSMAGVIARGPGTALMLTALREDRRNAWDEPDKKVIAALLPHLRQAQAIAERLSALEGGEAALNALAFGVCVITAGGVQFSNRAAEEIFKGGDGLSLHEGHIRASDSRSQALLQEMIRRALAPGKSLECLAGLLVRRPSMRRAYYVHATPHLGSSRPFIGVPSAAALVSIVDAERHRQIPADDLRCLFGLTSKEAMVAVKLSEGCTVQEAAQQLGMRYETARTHLRRVLSKTETSRQTELVTLLERLSPRLASPR